MNKTFFITALLSALALGLLACELTPESLSASLAETAAAVTTVRVTGAVVNVRSGPSVQYEILGQVQAGDRLSVTGISRNRTWLQVEVEAERRWIFADLTDVSAELRGTLAEVAAPALEGSVSASAGQSESAAVELEPPPPPRPTVTGGYAPGTQWSPPGSYGRHLLGLDYDFEIEWVDRSSQWDWDLKNQDGGCYDALRVFLRSQPKTFGVRKYELALTDPGETLNLDYYIQSPDLLISYRAEPRADIKAIAPSWPNWEGMLREDQGVAAGICHSNYLTQGFVPCELQIWWGEPSHNLEGAALESLAAAMGGTTYLPDLPSGATSWARNALENRKQYLAPFYVGTPAGPNVCFSVKRQE